MKILFIGLGSIGKRHLNNIKNYGEKIGLKFEIHALRSNNSKDQICEVDKEYYNYLDIDNNYDCCFICNPTYKHFEALVNTFNKCNYIFIEKPVFEHIKYDISFIKESDYNRIYVASPLRYNRVITEIELALEKQKVHSIRAICSSYLPNWRKNVDYRNVYSSHKSQGGGVSIDCIHEWDYITHIFGFPLEVHNIKNKVSNLEIDCEDVSTYIGNYKDKVVELHLDYFGVKTRREIEIITESGYIKGDLTNKEIYIYENEELKVKKLDFDLNEMYEKEMQYFLKTVCLGNGNENNIINAIKVLEIARS